MVVVVEVKVEYREHEHVKAVYRRVAKIDPWSIMSLSFPP
jgi:hypothetical protein